MERMASTTYPGGNVVAQTYTPRGQIAGIGLDGGTVASYEYNPVGATTAKTYENGLSALYSYDAAQRLVGLEHRRGLDLLAKIDYTLDKVGNRKSKTQSVLNPLTENYNYDAVDQLIEAKYGTARTVGYQYDAVGNRQWVSDNGMTAHYTANSDNGYTSVDGISTETDLNGNMVSVPGGAYAYDAQNRLVSATVNGVTTEFTYDSRNRVVRRTSVNGTLNLTYSGWHLIEERNASGALEQVYVHGAGTDEILVKITATGPAYYHHDGLGSTIALTGENGELLESYRYDAFGAASVYDSSGSALPASPRGNRFLFTGREWLSQVGLYDYRNRVYSAQIGRFLQTDPIRFSAGDVNLYRYVSNNPVNLWDPWGLCKENSLLDNLRESFDYIKDYAGGVKDFYDNYTDMREADWKESDKYFHAKANFESASRGEGGRDAAKNMSDSREVFDQTIKGDSQEASEKDQEANRHGRDQVGKAKNSKEAAKKYRPNGLPEKY